MWFPWIVVIVLGIWLGSWRYAPWGGTRNLVVGVTDGDERAIRLKVQCIIWNGIATRSRMQRSRIAENMFTPEDCV